jgi:deoxyribodipyrimidine photo-lyase
VAGGHRRDAVGLVRQLRIDHAVGPVVIEGGPVPAHARLSTFVEEVLPEYGARHNQPEEDATSRLSPWLHFGHLSAHEVFDASE